jgi:hypothetical protein
MVKFNQVTVFRSMFCLASIVPIANEVADKSRISVLALRENKASEADSKKFEETQRMWLELYRPEFLRGMRARSLQMLPKTLQAVELFRTKAATVIGAQRGADQVGTLLAGLWMLYNDDIPTADEVEEILIADDWAEEKSTSMHLDHVQCLEFLLQSTVKVTNYPTGTVDMSFGELIYKASDLLQGALYSLELARHGLMVKDGMLHVKHTHAKLAALFQRTPWGSNWTKAMKYLNGAHASKGTVYFGKEFGSHRCLSIPLEVVLGGNE